MEKSGWLVKGQAIETDGQSRALLKFDQFGQIEVDSSTRLELVETNQNEQRLSLTRGRIYVSINAPPRMFVVGTPAAAAIDLGCAYTLDVNEQGESLLRVTSGWVALRLGEREELVPSGTACLARPGQGAGTPYLQDSSQALQHALSQYDFSGGGAAAIDSILKEARPKDSITLWCLLSKVDAATRERIFARLFSFVQLPDGVTREGVLGLDSKMLQAWREKIDYMTLGIDPQNIDFETGTVRPTGSLNEARYGHTATLLPNGKVLIAGGQAKERNVLATAELFDPQTETFTPAATMNGKRVGHTATLLPNGKVLLTGGSDRSFDTGAIASAEIYDPASDTFAATGAMHYPRVAHRATLLKNGQVLITGGVIIDQTLDVPAEIYDPATGVFTEVGKLNYSRFDHTATLLDNGQVLLTGGGHTQNLEILIAAQAELYDPLSRTFRFTGTMHKARHKHSAIALPDGTVLIMGGADIYLMHGMTANAEIYNPHTEAFVETGQMSTARYKIRDAVVLLKNGKILVAGGGERLELYDSQAGIFIPVKGSLSAAIFMGTATLLSNGNVVIIGGYTDSRNTGILPAAGAWIYIPS
ncbi:MAG TPA: kelch repeat-containing protein [Pyrinomonadaceae bacterium]